MNVKIKKSFAIYTGLVYEDRFMINHYSVTLNILTVSTDHTEQNIAYDRMKHWVYHIMDDGILVHDQNIETDCYRASNARVLALPDEPVDQNVGIMLYLKLNAVMENRMVITDIETYSRQGDNATYIHSVGDNLGKFEHEQGWWTDPRPSWSTVRSDKTGKVVNLDRAPEWHDHGLGWQQFDQQKNTDSVITAFKRDEDQ